MPRQIGFGNKEKTRRKAKTDARALRPDPPRADRKTIFNILIPNLVLYLMAGGGAYIAWTGLTEGRIMGFVFGTIFAVAAFTFATSRLLKRILGLDQHRPTRIRDRNWTLDDPDP